MRKNVIKDKSFAFAIQIVNAYKLLVDDKREYIVSKQLLRSGTAIGALYREAEQAESRADFIHKLAVGLKECNEAIYWIELLEATDYFEKEYATDLYNKANELKKLLTAIIKTTKGIK